MGTASATESIAELTSQVRHALADLAKAEEDERAAYLQGAVKAPEVLTRIVASFRRKLVRAQHRQGDVLKVLGCALGKASHADGRVRTPILDPAVNEWLADLWGCPTQQSLTFLSGWFAGWDAACRLAARSRPTPSPLGAELANRDFAAILGQRLDACRMVAAVHAAPKDHPASGVDAFTPREIAWVNVQNAVRFYQTEVAK